MSTERPVVLRTAVGTENKTIEEPNQFSWERQPMSLLTGITGHSNNLEATLYSEQHIHITPPRTTPYD